MRRVAGFGVPRLASASAGAAGDVAAGGGATGGATGGGATGGATGGETGNALGGRDSVARCATAADLSPGQPPPGDKGDVRNEEEPVGRAPRDKKHRTRHNQWPDGCANAVGAVDQVEKPVAPRHRDGGIYRPVD